MGKQSTNPQHQSELIKTPLLKKYNLLIEHLEPEHITKCSDGTELERILKVLRSGEEGFYPHVIVHAEKRLAHIKPESKLLRTARPVITKEELPKEQRIQMQQDLKTWIDYVRKKDKELEKKKDEDCGKVWECDVRQGEEVKNVPQTEGKSNRIRSTDYASWDKFDVDAEMLMMDLKQERIKKEVDKKMKEKPKQSKSVRLKTFATEAEAVFEANRQKDMGNELFNTGEYEDALHHYTLSIDCKPLVQVYTNRAITNIKLKNYRSAIHDCKEALKHDPFNFKATLRMAQAYEHLEMYEEALEFAEKTIRIDPNNTAVQQFAYRMRQKLTDKSGNKTRIEIQDVDSYKPESGVKTKPIPKRRKSEVKAEKNGCSEIVPIPGTSKMYPPYYKVIQGEDEQELNAEKTKILKPQRMLYATTIYTGSDDETDVVANADPVRISKKKSKRTALKQNNEAKTAETNTPESLKISNLDKAVDVKSDRKVETTPNNKDERNKPSIITIPPKSQLHVPYTFLETWNSINDPTYTIHAEVIRKLNFERIDKVVGTNMESQMFSDMITCLRKHFMKKEEIEKAHSVLTNLVKIPRFKIMWAFLGKAEKGLVGELIEFLERHSSRLHGEVKHAYFC